MMTFEQAKATYAAWGISLTRHDDGDGLEYYALHETTQQALYAESLLEMHSRILDVFGDLLPGVLKPTQEQREQLIRLEANVRELDGLLFGLGASLDHGYPVMEIMSHIDGLIEGIRKDFIRFAEGLGGES